MSNKSPISLQKINCDVTKATVLMMYEINCVKQWLNIKVLLFYFLFSVTITFFKIYLQH